VSEASSLDLVSLTASITESYVGNNHIGTTEVGNLIAAIHGALEKAGAPAPEPEAGPTPAVSVRASVKPDHLVCLECGKKLKMIKRHLKTDHGESPEEYRAKFGLPRDYPMVASAYADQRRTLAKAIGLGRATRTVAEVVTAPLGSPSADFIPPRPINRP
jgi:predicted transcriptional regulator